MDAGWPPFSRSLSKALGKLIRRWRVSCLQPDKVCIADRGRKSGPRRGLGKGRVLPLPSSQFFSLELPHSHCGAKCALSLRNA